MREKEAKIWLYIGITVTVIIAIAFIVDIAHSFFHFHI